MLFRLPTVRAKLTALVATTVVVMAAMLPVLSWLLHRQLVDEVDDRVVEAEKSFAEELRDDLTDLELAAKMIRIDSDTTLALSQKNEKNARSLAEAFVAAYPEMDVLLFDATGRLLAQVGCAAPPTSLSAIAEVGDSRGEFRGLTAHGCETAASAPPAYIVALPIPGAGVVVVCMPFNAAHLANASRKIGLELALLGKDGTVLGTSPAFPSKDVAHVGNGSTIVEVPGKTFAMARMDPAELHGPTTSLGVVAALDVGDIELLVRRNLFFALGVLATAAVIAIAFGWRLASIMSSALKRVNHALARLKEQEYVHIDAVKTGDELEDLATGFNHMVDGLKERDKLRTTMGKYMSASVMDHLLAGKVELGGETLTVTILFSDIRGFTPISEKMDAQNLVAFLNEYFTEMVGIVIQEDGVVDKYIGDAIMAVFGAPVPKPDDAKNAVRAAVRMRAALAELNERLEKRGHPPLRTGIGIHTGEVVAGNIGSASRMEYTVIGDAVNLASRLESNTKDLGVNVLISEETYQLVKDDFITKPVKEITVKGKTQPVMTYQVLGLAEAEPKKEDAEAEA